MVDTYIQTRVHYIVNQYAHGALEVTKTSSLRNDLGLSDQEIDLICQDVEAEFQVSKFTDDQVRALNTPYCIAHWVAAKQAAQQSNRTQPKHFSLGVPAFMSLAS